MVGRYVREVFIYLPAQERLGLGYARAPDLDYDDDVRPSLQPTIPPSTQHALAYR
jgi:hypothetical protein